MIQIFPPIKEGTEESAEEALELTVRIVTVSTDIITRTVVKLDSAGLRNSHRLNAD